MRTRSMAPGAARWPQLIWAPSNAGPVGLEQASRRCAIAQHDLRVGADVDEQSQLVAQVGTLREYHAGGIRANMSGDTRQNVDARVRMQIQSDLRWPGW